MEKTEEKTKIPPRLNLKQMLEAPPLQIPNRTKKSEIKPEPQKYPKYINELNPGQFLENEDICQNTLVWFPRYCNGWNENRYNEIGWKCGWIIKRCLGPRHKDFIWSVQDEREINQNNLVNRVYKIYRRILYGPEKKV